MRGAAIPVLLLLVAVVAGAGEQAASLDISARVEPRCQIVASDLLFGSYDPLGVNATTGLDARAELRVTCTKGLLGVVLLGPGLFGAEGAQARMMASGDQRLQYQIFADEARSRVWGDGEGDGRTIVSASGREPIRLQLFGRVPAGQRVLSGRYTDAVTASVEF